jgi:hypothetical protein
MKIRILKEIKEPTADGWGLYTTAGREAAAKSLNRTFRIAVNSGKHERDVYADMVKAMRAKSAFGAADTEGYHCLGQLMRAAFGPNAYC